MADEPLVFRSSVECPFPWRSVIPAALAALVLGFLIGRMRR